MPALALVLGACVAVDRDLVHLSDLMPAASPDSAELSLGFAPVPGARRQFTASTINRLLSKQGLPPYLGPDICVERTGHQLEEASVKEALIRVLADPQAKVEIVAMDIKRIPEGALEFPLSGLVPPSPLRPDEPLLWRGRVRAGPNRSIPVWIKVKLRMPVTRVVALEQLAAGMPIRATQVRSEQLLDSHPAGAGALTAEGIEGWRPRRAIKTGEVLQAQWLQEPLLVRRGETVHASADRDGVRIRLDAIVESDGKKGDRVKIRSPFGDGFLAAVVESEGSVAILSGGRTR